MTSRQAPLGQLVNLIDVQGRFFWQTVLCEAKPVNESPMKTLAFDENGKLDPVYVAPKQEKRKEVGGGKNKKRRQKKARYRNKRYFWSGVTANGDTCWRRKSPALKS